MYINKQPTLLTGKESCRLHKTEGNKMSNQILDDHRDNRGFVVNPFSHLNNTGDISNCHAFSIEPGCSRGNHTHPARNEQVLVLSGAVSVKYCNKTVVLTAEFPSIFTIPEGIKHSFENDTQQTATLICWSSERKEGYRGDDTVW